MTVTTPTKSTTEAYREKVDEAAAASIDMRDRLVRAGMTDDIIAVLDHIHFHQHLHGMMFAAIRRIDSQLQLARAVTGLRTPSHADIPVLHDVDELEKLPVGTIVLDEDGDAWQRYESGHLGDPTLVWATPAHTGARRGTGRSTGTIASYAPIRVIFLPGEPTP